MPTPLALIWDLIAKDSASPAFLRVAGAADKAATATARAQSRIEGAAARMSVVGAKLTKGVTLPLVGLAAVSIDQAAKFQKSMNVIGVATDQTQKQLASSSKGLLSIAGQTGASLSDLSDSLYVVEKGGLRGSKALAAAKAAAQGAAAEGADLGTATQALTNIMASYGKSMSDPVAAENALIRGAGLAKTTYQDFAASLSNVVPLAASLHISFAQVAGAIDTMTQHGETAQRATDNLSNLITNLAGQNNVASKSLQQLGVDTIDLSKNLGTRGLTGSLQTVLDAINKYKGPDGMIVTSAFKQAAVATSSLQTELKAMPPSLQKISQQFASGSLSYKSYYKDVKDLGGQQYELGKNFITTMASAKGFSDQLKSGNSTVRTLATTLQKSLGGVTGMRVALMLSGASADQFKKSVEAVSKAAQTSGADVLGWAKTQATFAQQMKEAKSNLQVLAVEIGTALLPAVTKIIAAVSKAVQWFNNLSGTQKKILGWSLGVMAALGPILAIGGRLVLVGASIGNFVTMASTRLALLTGATGSVASSVVYSMGKVTSALAGAGIGFAIGTLTKNASTATKAVGALGSAAAGAAIGFGMGGPLGAAIGGVAGGLTALATSFLGAGDSAVKAVAGVDSLTSALQADSGAVGENTRAMVANALQKSGAYDDARKLGVGLQLVTQAALGNKSALNQITAATLRYQIGVYGAAKDTSAQNAASKELLAVLGAQSGSLAKARQGYENVREGLSGTTEATKGASAGLARAGASAQAASGKVNSLGIDSSKLSGALRALSGTYPVTIKAYDNASNVVRTVQGHIDSLHGKTVTISAITYYTDGGFSTKGSAGAKISGNAAGGAVRDGWFTVGEEGGPRGWELGLKSGSRLQFFSNAASRAMTGLDRLPGYASGSGGSVVAADKKQIKSLTDTLSKIGEKLSTATTALTATLSSFKDQMRTVAGAIRAGFDITTAGQASTDGTLSIAGQRAAAAAAAGYALTPEQEAALNGAPTVGSIISDLSGQIASAKTFRSQLAKLKSEGLSLSLYQQLADAGPGTAGSTVGLLAGASKSQINTLSTDYRSLVSVATGTGSDVASTFYGKQLDAQQATVNEIKSLKASVTASLAALQYDVKHVGSDMGHELNGVAKKADLTRRSNPSGRKY